MFPLYKNIKEFRLKMGLSQADLAEMTGYTDRSSIAKIENGEVDLQQSKIALFAKALHTTPQILLGWNDSLTDIEITNAIYFILNHLYSLIS